MVSFKPIGAARIIEIVSGSVLSSDSKSVGISQSEFEISELGEPLEVGPRGVSFIISDAFIKDVASTRAAMLIIHAALAEKVMPLVSATVKVCAVAKDAYLGLALFSKVIAQSDRVWDWRPETSGGAAINPSAEIDASVVVSPGVVISEDVKIAARTVLLPNCVIGPKAQIGSDCVIFPGVVIYPRTVVGARVRIHANSVIGSDGFGYARGAQGSVKIWHLGKVVIGDDVEIGSGTMIDRGTMKDTIIEEGAKIDNLVQIGHNGHVGAHAVLCGQTGLAGNVTVGAGAILAGKVGVADKLRIGKGAIVGPFSGLSKDVGDGEVVMGVIPARPRREWWNMVAQIDKLSEVFDRLKKLEKLGGKEE